MGTRKRLVSTNGQNHNLVAAECRHCKARANRVAAEFDRPGGCECSRCGAMMRVVGVTKQGEFHNAPKPPSKVKRGKQKRKPVRFLEAQPHEIFKVRKANYSEYTKSPYWKRTAARKRKSVGYRCESCKAKGYTEVHHLHYRTLWAETNQDLQVLCRPCHEKRHEFDRHVESHMRAIASEIG